MLRPLFYNLRTLATYQIDEREEVGLTLGQVVEEL
jgi:hypothetical protein